MWVILLSATSAGSTKETSAAAMPLIEHHFVFQLPVTPWSFSYQVWYVTLCSPGLPTLCRTILLVLVTVQLAKTEQEEWQHGKASAKSQTGPVRRGQSRQRAVYSVSEDTLRSGLVSSQFDHTEFSKIRKEIFILKIWIVHF